MRRRIFQRTAKRAIDLIVAAVVLLLCSPLMGCIAIWIRCKMGRPILFRQQRPGLHGQPFVLYKFRTMTDARRSDGVPEDIKRITSLGRLLRRASLDELPQFWNVLRGELSLVGPRPLLMKYLEFYTPEQARRHDVLPGITGWAQVNGRNAISWEEKFTLDLWYIDHWNLLLDFRILLATVVKTLHAKGINADANTTMPPFRGATKKAHSI